jgi:hypothetical protein
VAADAKPEAGAKAVCPACGREVMQHAMIPLLRDGVLGYECVDCARKHIVHDGDGAAPAHPTNAPDPAGV